MRCDDTRKLWNAKSSYPVSRLIQAEGSDEGHVDDFSVSIFQCRSTFDYSVSDPENVFINRAVVDGVTKAARTGIMIEHFCSPPPAFAVHAVEYMRRWESRYVPFT